MIPNLHFIDPGDLILDHKSKILNALGIQYEQFILELHQDEILSIPVDIIQHLVKSCKIVNDLRTIFLAHDKRLLALLSNDSILSEYLSKRHHDIIKKHRITTFVTSAIKTDLEMKNLLINKKDNWLVKPSLFGKGEGIMFGKNLTMENWSKLIEKLSNTDQFIVQEYVKQDKFNVFMDKQSYKLNMVGTLLCFNDTFLGPGIYRASSNDLVAFSRGGCILFPVKKTESDYYYQENGEPMYKTHRLLGIPEDSIFSLKSYSFKDCDKYKSLLIKNGIVLITLEFPDANSSYFCSLITSLGMEPCSHSGKENDYLWNIQPLVVDASKQFLPRSHTADVFQMHTDASFEPVPPRYFGLQVLKKDALNGGQTLLIKFDDVLKNLSLSEIDLLSSTQIKLKIPNEFKKSSHQENFILCTILSPRKDCFNNRLIRYRYDIILDRNSLTDEYKKALEKFESLIDIEKSELIKYINLRDNQIMIVDNSRWLHGRTQILDPNRHLVRIRFQTKNEGMLPWVN